MRYMTEQNCPSNRSIRRGSAVQDPAALVLARGQHPTVEHDPAAGGMGRQRALLFRVGDPLHAGFDGGLSQGGEVYASNTLAQDLCGRSREQMTGGRISVYELMTEASASKFFRLYELAVSGTQAEDGSYVPSVGKTEPLYWNAEIVKPSVQGAHTVVPTRGIFEMKIAPCGLPSLLVCCFVPLS